VYFVDVIKVLLRRWYVVLVGMVGVAGALFYAFTSVPTQYQATGQVLVLLPPEATGPENPTNPYMNLSPGLVTTATIIAEQLNNNTNHASVEEAGFTSEYALGVVPDTGPLLVITVKDTDPAEAEATLAEVVDRVGVQLKRMQENLDIPENQLMYTRRNDTNAGAEALPGSKIRAAGVLGGGGVVLTIIAAFVVDGFVRRRAARQEDEADEAADDAPSEEPATVPALTGTSRTGTSDKGGRTRRRRPAAGPAPEPGDEPEQRPRPRVVPNPRDDAGNKKPPPAREAPARRTASAKRR
jgi:hypothetical protein